MVKVVELSGGVGGARLARGLDGVPSVDLTVVVNVGDDEVIHGLYVSADLDTVTYTLAGVEGGQGWGRGTDSFNTNEELGKLGADNRFRLGDKDLALNILRTEALGTGTKLDEFTRRITKQLDIRSSVIPVTNEQVRTKIRTAQGDRLSFQEYFVIRQHRDDVDDLEFVGAARAKPAPGVLDAISEADVVVIGPSNPPLSIWPILAVEEVRDAIESHRNVVAVSPLFGGKALKGPADRVMASLGLLSGNAGVVEAYSGLINRLVIDISDAADASILQGLEITVADTRIPNAEAAIRFTESALLR